MRCREWFASWLPRLLAIPSLVVTAQAQSLRITDVRLGAQRELQFSYASDTNSYFVLHQGNSVTNISTPVQLKLGTNGDVQFITPATSAASFYRLRKVPAAQPLDTDGDGLDDVYELRNPPLNPLNAADGRLTTISSSSPANGETDVAVTRETILNFSLPLAPGTLLTTNHFYAGSSGRRVLSRIELSSDRRRATLFYLEPLPGGAFVSTVFDGTGLMDVLGRAIDADGDGQAGGTALIGFQTLSLAPLTNTAVIGRVFASEQVQGTNTTNFINRPLAGVTITVDGMEETLRTKTDAAGNFRLQPVPPGRFFVHIDGRTVTNLAEGIRYPDMSYYPFVGKEWEAIAGRTDTLAGGNGQIFLPLIVQGTLQTVSMTNDTVVGFPPAVLQKNPELAGVSVTVPANSLFSDNGTRGGRVGIAPVPPDRLPGPLPPGLELPIVITVQTDGALNFDRPAPICFPNVVDPVLGTPLPAGSKQALMSFNHDKGIWEAVGSMTVSEDGKLVCSDPGVGILQPGWHGVGPPPDGPPPCRNCCPADGGPQARGVRPKENARCKKPCNGKSSFGECIGACQATRDKNVKDLEEWLANKKTECEDKEQRLGKKHADTKKCWRSYQIDGLNRRQQILREYDACIEKCRNCPVGFQSLAESIAATAFPGAAFPKAEPISTADQIVIIFDQIFALLSSAYSDEQGMPDSALEQAAALEAQADAIAGGDARLFLRNVVIGAEQEERQDPDVTPHKTGNAPEYPIHYVATILRPNGAFFLRGETEPSGNYTLFVPRDGLLLDVSFYDSRTQEYGFVFPNKDPNAPYRLPRVTLLPLGPDASDSDQDGLPDLVESVYGTEPDVRDSDSDGIPDGAEVDQGTNPLDGRPTQTGIIATAKTTGTAVDVCALNDRVAAAEMDKGVSVFNVFNGMNPVLIAHVDTPGIAQRVACSGNLIAVADGAAGLAIVDVSDPATARIVHQVDLGGTAQAVTTAGGLAYVGLGSGQVVVVDLTSGVILQQAAAAGSIQDLGLGGEFLYVLTADKLHTFSIQDGDLAFSSTANSTVFASGNRRLFAGDRFAYATQNKGVNTFSLTNPAVPVLLNAANTTQFGWKQFVPNGSGLALAADDPNFALDGPNDISLYDLANPTNTQAFLTKFPTPGIAYAVSIFNGLAYVADGAAGLQVVNYLPYDNRGTNPTISLSASFPLASGLAEEGKLVRVTASVTDDVQVRNVEFYVDGVKVATDGNFPFEIRFVTPAISATRSNFTVRACAFDTGGNSACTTTYTLTLVPDATPPRVGRPIPAANTVVTSAPAVIVSFTEPINLGTLNAATFNLKFAGPDNKLDTADDAPASGSISWRDTANAAALSFSAPLPFGLYRGTVTTGIRDLAGNALQNAVNWTFWVLAGGATGDEDDDGLSNTNEIARGTNPFLADSDGDSWTDGVEAADGFDPLSTNSTPRMYFAGKPPVDVLFPTFDEGATNTVGVTVGAPPIEIFFPIADDAHSGSAVTVGRPPVEVFFPAPDENDSAPAGTTLGRPPIVIRFIP